MNNETAASILAQCAEMQKCTLFEVFANVMKDKEIVRRYLFPDEGVVENHELCLVAVIQCRNSLNAGELNGR